MKLKKFFTVLCIAALCGCSAPANNTSQNQTGSETAAENSSTETVHSEDFADYLHRYVVEMCEESYLTMHSYFEDPQAYGIDPSKAEISLGHVMETDEEEDLEEDLDAELETYDYDSLSPVQQTVYDQMKWEFDLYEAGSDEKYDYLDNIWSSFSGQQQVLVTFFSEYELYKEEDIEPLITLINDIPRYIEECLEYSKKQAELGLLMFDYDGVIEDCQEVLDTKETSAIASELEDEVDNLHLEDEKAAEYKKRIRQALEDSFFPGYQKIIDGLKELKDDVKAPAGLASLKNGKAYYEILTQKATGCDDDPALMKSNMNDMLSQIEDEYYNLLMKHYNSAEKADSLKTRFTSVEEIMEFLADQYSSQFPIVDTMNYNLQALSSEQSQEGIVAYFLVPPVDYTGQYQIRYNERDYGKDPTDLSLYQTLAHEGIPGHMYQYQYNKQQYEYPIQYMLSNLGLSEGYATYVESQALKFLDLDEYALQAYNLNNLYSNFTICCMDIDINYYGMTLKEFQEEYGAGMDDIYTLLADNPTAFLSYYYGYYKIQTLRNEAREALGDTFNDIDFNNALLASGEVNFKLVQKSVDEYIEEG